jgi:N6-L-threonylcarbamoyladenine synthase
MRGKPLMPTTPRKARMLLRDGKAKVVGRTPFTIQLTYATGETTQPVTLGVDAGSKTIGLSATTEKEELYASELALRTDVVDLLSTRREYRRARRNRKTRYRKPRFNNRVKSKHKGWLAPSIEQKINTHIQAVKQIHAILPISKIVVEVAAFDIQKIKNPEIGGAEYQNGEMAGHGGNVREYVLWRDGHTCRNCGGKSKDKILNVHHIESRKTGGDTPNNLITLCKTCHDGHHSGKIELSVKRGVAYRDAAFMGIMRWAFCDRLKALYPNVGITYGYITKNRRIANGLAKTHSVDARCISGNPQARATDDVFVQKAVRKHNRQIHKATINKGGYRKPNQSPKYVFGFQLFDKVRMPDGREGFVFGRRASGSFDVRTLNGIKLSAGISHKKLAHLERRKTILTERRAASSHA